MLKQVICLRTDLNMRKGKMSAQSSHASKAFLSHQINNYPRREGGNEVVITLSNAQFSWLKSGTTTIVVGVDSKEELEELIDKARKKKITVFPIIDAGKTEFKGVPTLTCAAFGPWNDEELNEITGHLKLL